MSSIHACASFEDMKRKVCQSIGLLIKNDLILIEQEASEWAISHRLAVYLEPLFPEWNVDCEYNRQGTGGDPKLRDGGATCRPDIVIHHRTLTDARDNLLVIEIKLKAEDSKDDSCKVKEYTSPTSASTTTEGNEKQRTYQYQVGLVLAFKQKPNKRYELDPKLMWFKDGKKIS